MEENKHYGFTRVNLWIFVASILLIIIGYILMSGGKSPDPQDFDPSIFSFRRIVLAPILTTLGYLGVIPALLYRPKRKRRVVPGEMPNTTSHE